MDQPPISSIQQSPWIKHWAGQWSILSCSYFGHQYTETIQRLLHTRVKRCIILSSKGTSTAFFEANDLRAFGNDWRAMVEKNPIIILDWCNELKKRTDIILFTIKELEGKEPTSQNFYPFIESLYAYTQAHIAVKKVVDYLSPMQLEKWLSQLEEVRIYSEKVYSETEIFVQQFTLALSKITHYSSELLLCLVKEELKEYFENGKLPKQEILEARFHSAALIFDSGKQSIYSGEIVKEMENAILNKPFTGELKGFCAFPGKARGRVKIILNPNAPVIFAEGEILVTGMTRPDYFSFFKKAAAVVTDAGGVLSHAAITAREMKKPTIIGTLTSTKVLKDGDLVEVDAQKGIILKIVQ